MFEAQGVNGMPHVSSHTWSSAACQYPFNESGMQHGTHLMYANVEHARRDAIGLWTECVLCDVAIHRTSLTLGSTKFGRYRSLQHAVRDMQCVVYVSTTQKFLTCTGHAADKIRLAPTNSIKTHTIVYIATAHKSTAAAKFATMSPGSRQPWFQSGCGLCVRSAAKRAQLSVQQCA